MPKSYSTPCYVPTHFGPLRRRPNYDSYSRASPATIGTTVAVPLLLRPLRTAEDMLGSIYGYQMSVDEVSE